MLQIITNCSLSDRNTYPFSTFEKTALPKGKTAYVLWTIGTKIDFIVIVQLSGVDNLWNISLSKSTTQNKSFECFTIEKQNKEIIRELQSPEFICHRKLYLAK